MDKLDKVLRKLTAKEHSQVRAILEKLKSGDLRGLDIKKLRGKEDVYRVRKGALRIIYRVGKDKTIFVLAIERRSKGTYKNL